MTEGFLESRRTLWIVGAVAIVLFVVTNLPWQLDDYDQAKQAYTSFEMVKEGHWFYQKTPHERVATKPPLVGWISAGFFAVVGFSLASAIASRGDCDVDPVVSRGEFCLRIHPRIDRAERVRIELVDSAPGHISAHRHGARSGDISNRPANLEPHS